MPQRADRLRRRQEAADRDHGREARADPEAPRGDRPRSLDRLGCAARREPQGPRARRGDDGRRPQSGEDRLPRAARMTMMAQEEEESNGYKVTLPAFQGPLDLLLHLIKKNEVDIYDIHILLITQQYNQYLEAMEQLDLEVAADFVYMAALLINIKSKMLLPRDESADPAEDPRKELVDRLLEYQRFKAVAETFAELDVVRMGVWPRPAQPIPGADEQTELDMSEVGLFDLIDAFRSALNRYKLNHPQAIELKRTVHKVSEKMGGL